MVSDGILEARDPRGEEHGRERLSRRLRTCTGSADDVIKAILADIDEHAGEAAQGDDVTMVAIRIEERRATRKTTTLPGVALVDATEDGAPTDDSAAPTDGSI